VRVQYGYLKKLPEDYTGPRHVVTVKQLPPGPGGDDWFEWEERPGPWPVSNDTGPNDEIRIHVLVRGGEREGLNPRTRRPETATDMND
jgi:hypothetical protein